MIAGDKNPRVGFPGPGYGETEAHPSLALIKYWGKADREKNLPATPSLAVTLSGLTTRTRVRLHLLENEGPPADEVHVDGVLQDAKRSTPFFREFRRIITEKYPNPEPFSIRAESFSDFPSSAGLASSSSGFAALAVACSRAAGLELSPEELSSLARVGSASAARSLFGGFTRLDARASFARQVFDENWWPEFRIIVIEVEKGPKAISSRQAMESTRISSPYYSSWVKDSGVLMEKAVKALENKDLKTLGPLIRMSYLRMFGSMLAADPPVVYWKPESLSLIRMCEESRAGGIPVWETMDAGPQVKLFCTENETRSICSRLDKEFPALSYRICSPGKAPGKPTGGTFRQPDPGYRNPGDPET